MMGVGAATVMTMAVMRRRKRCWMSMATSSAGMRSAAVMMMATALGHQMAVTLGTLVVVWGAARLGRGTTAGRQGEAQSATGRVMHRLGRGGKGGLT
jgi:hypothetical protein